MDKDDLVYLYYMVEHARKAIEKVKGVSRADYDRIEDLRFVLLHLVQIIGEAARHVSLEFQSQHPDIPWANVIGMRHKIVHDYMDINERILLDVVTIELPRLLPKLEAAAGPSLNS